MEKTLDSQSPPRAVLWDLDGVLADTGRFHYVAWRAALEAAGLPFSPEMFQATFGMNNRGTLAAVLGRPPEPDLLERISGGKEEAFRAAIRGRARPLPGVRALLAALRAAGWRQALASSAPPENITLLMDELELRPYFAALVSAERLPSKPDPAVFLEAARQAGAPPARCVVIEDAVPGVEAARRAGMRVIAVTTTNPPAALAAADLIADSLETVTPADLEDLIARGP
jgi:HAD superfamily hydrolase (TIGR01509 family)